MAEEKINLESDFNWQTSQDKFTFYFHETQTLPLLQTACQYIGPFSPNLFHYCLMLASFAKRSLLASHGQLFALFFHTEIATSSNMNMLSAT